MDFDEALSYLLSLGHETLAMKLGLTNTALLLQALANPESTYPAVQIAGTNGKGSTAVMLDSICRAAGLRTGLFTSPHLQRITERVRVAGQEMSPADFARLATVVRDAAQRLADARAIPVLPTFFEHVTTLALLAFAEARIDLAILETGLGGRLDSTTVARAGTVAITPVALDHQEYLGETLNEIAAEKAAIIRPGIRVILAPQSAEVRAVMLNRCQDCDVTPYPDDCAIDITGANADGRLRATFQTKRDRYDDVTLGLRGRHQISNASTAIRLAESLVETGFPITRAAIVQGLETAEHPGRLELRSGQPALLFDGAHNPSGARALRRYLDEFVKVPITIVFGAMRDKDLKEMTKALFPVAESIVLTQPDNPRAAALTDLERFVPQIAPPQTLAVATSAAIALHRAYDLTPADGLICITGSLYLIGEMQTILSQNK